MATLRESAEVVIDTSGLSVHDLKRRVQGLSRNEREDRGPELHIQSFGFKHGLVVDADLVLDVRFLPNPYFVESLREQSGMDTEVARFVLDREVTGSFLERVLDLLRFLLPHYREEGKAYLTIAFGCTGGRHRSVAIAEEVAGRLRADGHPISVNHRDVER